MRDFDPLAANSAKANAIGIEHQTDAGQERPNRQIEIRLGQSFTQ